MRGLKYWRVCWKGRAAAANGVTYQSQNHHRRLVVGEVIMAREFFPFQAQLQNFGIGLPRFRFMSITRLKK
jgi:hypothetical protein